MEVKRKYGCLRVIGWIAIVLAWIILISAIIAAISVYFGVNHNIFRWLGFTSLPFGILAFIQLYVIGKLIVLATDVEYNTRVTAASVDNFNSGMSELKESGRSSAAAISALSGSVDGVQAEVEPLAAAVVAATAATVAMQAKPEQLPPPPPPPEPELEPEAAPEPEPEAEPVADEDADAEPADDADVDTEPATDADAEPEPEPEPEPVAVSDDFTKLEGVGPKISGLLNDNGITTYQQLADTSVEDLSGVLTDAGLRFANPESWPEQAKFAADGDWDGLAAYQQSLRGGRTA